MPPTIVVNDMAETIELAKFITGQRNVNDFAEAFKGRFSEGFDINKHLVKFGVVNQTTQLATDTQAISDYLKTVMINKYQLTQNHVHK